jgi:hypothetical protein
MEESVVLLKYFKEEAIICRYTLAYFILRRIDLMSADSYFFSELLVWEWVRGCSP